jgi:hypothetical protein
VSGLLQAFFYDPNPTFGASPTPFIVLMIMGFVIGVIGHIVRAKGLVAIGIAMIFLATFLLPLITNVLKSQQ